jgi:hypothetical protein
MSFELSSRVSIGGIKLKTLSDNVIEKKKKTLNSFKPPSQTKDNH